jgi:hypothetical protein
VSYNAQGKNINTMKTVTQKRADTITLSITEYEQLKRDAKIGELVRSKLLSGNSVPVSRCYINASEVFAISEDKHNG